MKKILKYFGCGVIIGISNIIPGFSGGTMALILGVLVQITDSISNLKRQFSKSIKTLLPIGLGIITGIIISTFTVNILLETWPMLISSFFVGLVVATIPIVFKETNYQKPKSKDIICFIVLLIISISLVYLKNKGFEINIDNPNLLTILYIFIIAIIAAATMVIPAASGSLILLAFGLYTSMLNILKEIINCLFNLNFPKAFSYLDVIIPFILGCLIGIILISKLMTYAFKKYKTTIWYGILALLFTSIYTIYNETYHNYFENNIELLTDNLFLTITTSIISIVIAYLFLSVLMEYSHKLKQRC